MIAFLRRLNLFSLWLMVPALLIAARSALATFTSLDETWPLFDGALDLISFAAACAFHFALGSRLFDAVEPLAISRAAKLLIWLLLAGVLLLTQPPVYVLPFAVLALGSVIVASFALSLLSTAICFVLAALFLPAGVASVDGWADLLDRD
ncbi:hypothetical protein SAMN06295912_102259 [Sphingomonas laterariae]|uniref:Uncharacterized protein n=1 Tax=Edaphosphingomonas laterariae TaxID=861865 RepID=A0A239CLK0_9SPHN|nr:hypothetical protein [Sphingomonas laterariae]SNS20561.1 hypothetical protein SAMN06295912_102259 [Sphingomonas laterariae]